jgi:hypothetical protein
MKIIIYGWLHPKNKNALVNYKNIDCIFTNNIDNIESEYDLNSIDCIYLPSCSNIDIKKLSKYNITFLFGPHFSVLPEENKLRYIISDKSIYIQPSDWVCNIWKRYECCNNLNIKTLPFGVDTETFKNDKLIEKRDKIFIYFKYRFPTELEYLENFFKNKNIEYIIFYYEKTYKEGQYLSYLKECKYGVFVTSSESQGFALEEALSCNVPLLVWDVRTLNDQTAATLPSYFATSIPYWDNRCGEFFYDKDELEEKHKLFISNLDKYNPREYILENLTYEKCEEKLIKLINEK